MNYGSTIVLLKGHCLYMRGWWRLSRGYLKKALADFRTVINPATQSPRTMTVRASLLLKTLSHLASNALSLKKKVPYDRRQLLKEISECITIEGVTLPVYNNEEEEEENENEEDGFNEREEEEEEEKKETEIDGTKIVGV